MIPLDLMKTGYLLFWKLGGYKPAGAPSWLVGNISKRIPETDDKYSHVGMVDRNPKFIIHSKPPRVIRQKFDADFWHKNSRRHELELWKLKTGDEMMTLNGVTKMRREWAVDFYWKNNFLYDKTGKLIEKRNSKGELVGRRYDVLAIASSGLFQNWRKPHCSESVSKACLMTGEILTPSGAYDPTTSPNENIASNRLVKVY